MIPQELLDEAVAFARQQAEQFGTPPFPLTEFISQEGQRLAKNHNADANIVFVGINLMDALLGKALAEGKPQEHIQRSEDSTRQLLSKYPELTKAEQDNILACVRQHHGGAKFYSLESEICCNADCYKFASVRGVLIGHQGRKAPIEQLVKLYKDKLDEKWKALSMVDCKSELKPQCKVIKAFLEGLV